MLEEPPEKPLMSLAYGDVNILDKRGKKLSMTINIFCEKDEINSIETQQEIVDKTVWMRTYLILEGFISTTAGWNIAVAVIAKSPDNQQ